MNFHIKEKAAQHDSWAAAIIYVIIYFINSIKSVRFSLS